MIQVLIISSLYSQTQHLRRILLGQAGPRKTNMSSTVWRSWSC